MILDYLSPDVPADIQSQICIVGGGPAGITLALELAKSGNQVVLVESGGTTPTAEAQQLYKGDVIGRPYYPLEAARLRVLGGSSLHWGGWCGVFSDMDFRQRDWIPYSGWPISKSDLDEYYAQAHPYLRLGPYEYGSEYWSDKYSNFPDFEKDNIISRFLQITKPPIRFGSAYLSELESSEHIRVYINANATRLVLDETGKRIAQIDLQNLAGRRGLVKAQTYIIACGGIENPRLLLASNNVNKNGVGNDKGLVGRFFMEHFEFPCARVFDYDASQVLDLRRLAIQPGLEIGALFCPSPAKQKSLRMAHGSTMFETPHLPYLMAKDGWRSFLAFRDIFKERRLPQDTAAELKLWLKDFDTFAGVLALRLRGIPIEGLDLANNGIFSINVMAEQVPNPNSRVLLSDKQDLFGNPLANLDWQFSPIDRRTIRQTMILIGAEINRLGIGRFQLNEWLRDENSTAWSPDLRGVFHHMGTTRMADSDAAGVVDGNCKVHGVANLYVAGSSVFATSSYVNPTLTIVALAIRLADHLAASRQS